MYFEDLHKQKEKFDITIIKVGWLDIHSPYKTGVCQKEFVDKLKKIEPQIKTRGWHICPFCKNATSNKQFIIPVEGEYKWFYNVPEMIIHYIEEHDYFPPKEFIDTIMKFEI
jgi:hypothetical protein